MFPVFSVCLVYVFSCIQAALIQVGAKECLVADATRDEIELKKLKGLLEKCTVMCTGVKKSKLSFFFF